MHVSDIGKSLFSFNIINFIIFIDIPIVEVGSEALNSSYGDSVTLECNVSSKSPLKQIYWERNSSGNVLNITSEITGIHGVSTGNPGLTINTTTLSDSGFYTCVAENSYGIGKSISMQLYIKGGYFLFI